MSSIGIAITNGLWICMLHKNNMHILIVDVAGMVNSCYNYMSNWAHIIIIVVMFIVVIAVSLHECCNGG